MSISTSTEHHKQFHHATFIYAEAAFDNSLAEMNAVSTLCTRHKERPVTLQPQPFYHYYSIPQYIINRVAFVLPQFSVTLHSPIHKRRHYEVGECKRLELYDLHCSLKIEEMFGDHKCKKR